MPLILNPCTLEALVSTQTSFLGRFNQNDSSTYCLNFSNRSLFVRQLPFAITRNPIHGGEHAKIYQLQQQTWPLKGTVSPP